MHSFAVAAALLATSCLAQPMEKRDVITVTNYEVTYETVWVNPGETRPTPIPTPDAPSPPKDALPSAASVRAAEEPESSSSRQRVAETHAPVQAAVPAPSTTADPVEAVAPKAAAPAVEAPAPNIKAAGSASSARVGNSLQAAAVHGHNVLRAKHNAAPLSWDHDLAASAQALAATCKFHHDTTLGPASEYGQNIAFSYGTLGLHDKVKELRDVIESSWYTTEAQKFKQLGLYGMANPLNIDFDAWGHFTQQVWKSTTKVGCAVQTCADDKGYYTVCNYDPAGNFANAFAKNVQA